jgi:hypothetical protein
MLNGRRPCSRPHPTEAYISGVDPYLCLAQAFDSRCQLVTGPHRPLRRRTYPSEGSMEAVQLAGFVSRSRCGIIADRGEFEHRMPVCFGDEGCNRGVDRRGEV